MTGNWTEQSTSAVDELLRLATLMSNHVDDSDAAKRAHSDQLRAAIRDRPELSKVMCRKHVAEVMCAFIGLELHDRETVLEAFRDLLNLHEVRRQS